MNKFFVKEAQIGQNRWKSHPFNRWELEISIRWDQVFSHRLNIYRYIPLIEWMNNEWEHTNFWCWMYEQETYTPITKPLWVFKWSHKISLNYKGIVSLMDNYFGEVNKFVSQIALFIKRLTFFLKKFPKRRNWIPKRLNWSLWLKNKSKLIMCLKLKLVIGG